MALARFSEAGKFSLNKYNYSHSNSGVSDRRGILGKIRKLFHFWKIAKLLTPRSKVAPRAPNRERIRCFFARFRHSVELSVFDLFVFHLSPLPILFGRKALKVDSFARGKSWVFRAHFCLVQWKMVRNQRRRYKFKRKKTQTVDESQATGSGNS